MKRPRIAILLDSLPMGGAEKVLLSIAREASQQHCNVDLLLVRRKGELLAEVPENVRTIEIGRLSRVRSLPAVLKFGGRDMAWAALSDLPSTLRALPQIRSYLTREHPDAMLTTLTANNLAAIWAKYELPLRTRVVIREASTLSVDVAAQEGAFSRKLIGLARAWYPRADGIVAVSHGVASDLSHFLGLPSSRVTPIHNPVDLARIQTLAKEPLNDPWFEEGQPPVIASVGRIEAAKDYPTLISAFKTVSDQTPCRLLILGDGSLKSELEALIASLDLTESVRLPGTEINPFRYVARSRIFVLSSTLEGFPNSLLESLACGCSVVSTDCPSGPRELLDDGAFGRLVPVGDSGALARAILATLKAPIASRDELIRRSASYTPADITKKYLDLLLG